MAGINAEFGTTYTAETFEGSNFYKYFYAIAQMVESNEIKTAESFLKLQDYFRTTNERVLRPKTTAPGIIDYFDSKGFLVSVKPPLDADAGKLFVCVDVDDAADDYDDTKLLLCGYIKDCCVAGVISQGTESEEITLENLQSFEFKYNLPDKIPTLLKLTITLSENNEYVIQSPEVVVETLLANIEERYALGRNFEPQRYFSVLDAPWAAAVKLEYSIDAGSNWLTAVYDSEYDELLTFDIDDVTLIED
jgi:hypothetical protein